MSLFYEERVSEESIKMNLIEFAKIFPKIYLDTDFQRFFRWPSGRGIEYFISLISGIGNTKIMLVSIKAAIEYAREINDQHSLMYLTNLSIKGYEYISLDGNSRSTYSALQILGFIPTILECIKGPKTEIHNKEYDLGITWNSDLLPKNEKFTETIAAMTRCVKSKKIPPKFALYQIKDKDTIKKENLFKYNGGSDKIELEDCDIENLIKMYEYYTSKLVFNIEVWEKLSRPEMNVVFVNQNKNESIIRQDIRNAMDCGMSTSVRTIPAELRKCFEKNMGTKDLQTRKHHEMMGMCLYYLQHETALKNGRSFNAATALDKFWVESRPNEFTSTEKDIWKVFVKLANTQTKSLSSSAYFLDLFCIAKWIVQNNIATSLIDANVVDETNIGWENVMKLHAEWMQSQMSRGAIFKVSKGKGDWEAYRGGIKWFTYRDENGNVEWSTSLENFLTNNRHKCGLIVKNKRENVNTPAIRLALWYKQNEIDPLTGKKIPFAEIYNTDRKTGYEVDHVVAIENGGTNDFDNLQLVAGIPNAQKSDIINYVPNFENVENN